MLLAGCMWGDKDDGDSTCVIKKTCFIDCFNPVSTFTLYFMVSTTFTVHAQHPLLIVVSFCL